MNNDRKIIVFFISIPLAAILIIFLVSKVKFDLSLSSLERKLFNFNYESTPKIVERIPVPVKSIKSPIVISKKPERGFPDAPLINVTPPVSGTDRKVSLIFVNRSRRMAIIDGKLLHEGDVFDRHRIARIEKDKVLLKNREGESWLKLE
ncbi:MAG: hypothetical protein V1766_12470 [Pseudomonadota bacterium]